LKRAALRPFFNSGYKIDPKEQSTAEISITAACLHDRKNEVCLQNNCRTSKCKFHAAKLTTRERQKLASYCRLDWKAQPSTSHSTSAILFSFPHPENADPEGTVLT